MRISHPNLIYFQTKDLRGSLQRPRQDHLHHHLGHCHCLQCGCIYNINYILSSGTMT